MKHIVVYLLIFSGILAACSRNGNPKETLTNDLEKTVIKPFSDSLKADTFKLKLIGDEPKKMTLLFTITSFEGKEIYNISIKATDLFKNYDATIDLTKKNNQVKFISDEAARFFDDENFMEPAVTEQEQPDQYVPDKLFFAELKQTQLNGFIYRLGKENKIYIAWSVQQKKTKTYYNCCK
ncbi:hypothetical protein [Pedobacter metabolipauper]|uniref:Lipoprotein n=1 Tax=Pedobacter metabolipauper TaxID=425513 RepID=A0A4R6SX68_9SPHI|nr:hypothetical protein [Pedobacter metabolipauper]TDQ11114.1 hypothetical protein ATK78_0229 [Pedobacter metabolipauper]